MQINTEHQIRRYRVDDILPVREGISYILTTQIKGLTTTETFKSHYDITNLVYNGLNLNYQSLFFITRNLTMSSKTLFQILETKEFSKYLLYVFYKSSSAIPGLEFRTPDMHSNQQ